MHRVTSFASWILSRLRSRCEIFQKLSRMETLASYCWIPLQCTAALDTFITFATIMKMINMQSLEIFPPFLLVSPPPPPPPCRRCQCQDAPPGFQTSPSITFFQHCHLLCLPLPLPLSASSSLSLQSSVAMTSNLTIVSIGVVMTRVLSCCSREGSSVTRFLQIRIVTIVMMRMMSATIMKMIFCDKTNI